MVYNCEKKTYHRKVTERTGVTDGLRAVKVNYHKWAGMQLDGQKTNGPLKPQNGTNAKRKSPQTPSQKTLDQRHNGSTSKLDNNCKRPRKMDK